MRFILFCIVYFSLACLSCKSQPAAPLTTQSTSIPKGQFIFPLNPGQPTSLSGSFGDIRVNHFHSGLDVRTGGVEGKPLVAIGNGYISRINVSTSGYGNALYITHPNGFVSVYAHLSEFAPKIKQRLVQEQYRRQTFMLDFLLGANEIPVTQGELVALSGNSGGSGGPHLHFEIRDLSENTLDPALFGFAEIQDSKSPVLEVVKLVPMDVNSRINGEYKELVARATVVNGRYTIPNVRGTGRIGVLLHAYDKNNLSPFRLGITEIDMQVNNRPVFNFLLRQMPFDNKIDMNVHTDYESMVAGGRKYHKAFVDVGNRLPFYSGGEWAGILEVDSEPANVTVKLIDTQQNFSRLNFSITPEPLQAVATNLQPAFVGSPSITYSILNNVLRIEATGCQSFTNTAILYDNFSQKNLGSAYSVGNKKVFLYPVEQGLIKSVQVENTLVPVTYNTHLTPEQPAVDFPNFSVDFTDALYKPLILRFENRGSELYLDEDIHPLRKSFKVTWQTNQDVSSPYVGVYLKDKKPKFVPARKHGNSVVFHPKELGTYQLLVDAIPPTIAPRQVNAQGLRFIITDELSGIKSYECRINGEWILMEWEPKQSVIWSEKLDSSKPFQGNVVLKVTDNSGNTSNFEAIIL